MSGAAAATGHELRVQEHRVGDSFACVADNVDPGANVARARAATREAAEAEALAKACERLPPGARGAP